MKKIDELFNDPIIELNNKNAKNDMIYFKNETLKEIKEAKNKMLDKYTNLDNSIKDKFEFYEKRISSYELKIEELSKLITTDKTMKEKVEELLEFKEKTNDTILTEKIRLDNFRNDLKDNVTRIDKILSDSVIYPGIVGGISKYKTFHDLIDYVLTQCSLNLTFREKNIMDLKSYKIKLEGLIETFNSQVKNIIKTAGDFTKACVKESEIKTNSMFSILEDRMSETRIENSNYAIGLEKLSKNLKSEIKNLCTLKDELNQKVDTSLTEMRKDNIKIIKLFSGYKKGFSILQHKFTQLSEFIKDMRFRTNLKEDVQRREFSKMADLINFDKKKKGFYEGVIEGLAKSNKIFEVHLKDYISGKITAEELLKKYNSVSNINEQKRKSMVGGNMNSIKKFNSFANDLYDNDKNNINNLLRGSMANPLRKKFSLEIDPTKIDLIKKQEEIKEVDEDDILSSCGVNKNKKRESIKKNSSSKEKKESEDLFENLYEDVNIDDIEEEKNDLNKTGKESKNNNISKSKHGRGSIRNNIANIIKAEKLFKNFKKLNPIEKDKSLILKKETNINKVKIIKDLNLNISNNNIDDNKGNKNIHSEKNEDSKGSINKIIKNEITKDILNIEDNNNFANKSSTLYNYKFNNMSEPMLKEKSKIETIESADRCKHLKKENKFNEKERLNKKIGTAKNNLYDFEFFLPEDIVHNATIVAYMPKNDDENIGNKKGTPEKRSKISEIKSVSNLILTSFNPKKSKYDLSVENRNLNKINIKK